MFNALREVRLALCLKSRPFLLEPALNRVLEVLLQLFILERRNILFVFCLLQFSEHFFFDRFKFGNVREFLLDD